MKIPNPYFENVLDYGNLRMEQIIVEYDYPLLSVLIDDKKNRYLSMCFDTRGSQQWLIASISSERLIELLTNRITLDAPYRESQTKIIYAVRNYETKVETFCEMQPIDIPDENLPAKGEYLEAEENEWETYIEQLQKENGQWMDSYEEQPICCIVSKQLRNLIVVLTKSKQGFEKTEACRSTQQIMTQKFSPRLCSTY